MAVSLVLLIAPAAVGQSLEQKKQKKLQSKFLKNGTWYTDFDKAKAASRESGKLIFAYFTRSYAY
jgi:hypothetical protein